MKRIVFIFLVLCVMQMAFAVDVPGITTADFDATEAHWIWSTLAGEGLLGAILFGVLALLKKYAKPYLDEWAAQKRLSRLLNAVEAGVVGAQQVYVESIKEASADGKLTKYEADIAKEKARKFIIDYMKVQGVDVVREYGIVLLDYLIEYILGKMKLDNVLMKSVASPLSVLESPPLPELAPATQVKTDAVYG